MTSRTEQRRQRNGSSMGNPAVIARLTTIESRTAYRLPVPDVVVPKVGIDPHLIAFLTAPDEFLEKQSNHLTLKDKLIKPALLMLPAGNVTKPLLMLPAGAIAMPVPEDKPLVNAAINFEDRLIWKQAAEQGQKLTALMQGRYSWKTGKVSPRKVAKAA
jgi:hypothetical protein